MIKLLKKRKTFLKKKKEKRLQAHTHFNRLGIEKMTRGSAVNMHEKKKKKKRSRAGNAKGPLF